MTTLLSNDDRQATVSLSVRDALILYAVLSETAELMKAGETVVRGAELTERLTATEAEVQQAREEIGVVMEAFIEAGANLP